MDLGISQRLWILHPDGPSGPEWRRVTMSLDVSESDTVHAKFKIRQLAGGATGSDLFHNIAFRGSLDRVFEKILRKAIGSTLPYYELLALTRNCLSKSYSQPNPSVSPQMSFRLSGSVSEFLCPISNHLRANLAAAAKEIAREQDCFRANFGALAAA